MLSYETFIDTGEGPPNYGNGYRTLLNAVDRGDLVFRYYFSQFGTGSTALLMWLRDYFDIAVMEPDGQLLPKAKGEHTTEAVYDYIANIYTNHHRTNPKQPLRMVVKFMSTAWLPTEVGAGLYALNQDPMFLVRHPVLSLESWLRRQLTLHLSEKDHGLSREDIASINAAKKSRDYSHIDTALLNQLQNYLIKGQVIGTSPASFRPDNFLRSLLYGVPSLMEVLQREFAHNEVFTSHTTQSLIEEGVFQRELDWWFSELVDLYHVHGHFKRHIGKPFSNILDFTVFQTNPERFGQHLLRNAWKMPRVEKGEACPLYNFYEDRHDLNDVMFQKAFQNGSQIAPPTETPLSLRQFPKIYQKLLPRLIQAYYIVLAQTSFPHLRPEEVAPGLNPLLALGSILLKSKEDATRTPLQILKTLPKLKGLDFTYALEAVKALLEGSVEDPLRSYKLRGYKGRALEVLNHS